MTYHKGDAVTDGKYTARVLKSFTSFDCLGAGTLCLSVVYPDGFIDECTRRSHESAIRR